MGFSITFLFYVNIEVSIPGDSDERKQSLLDLRKADVPFHSFPNPQRPTPYSNVHPKSRNYPRYYLLFKSVNVSGSMFAYFSQKLEKCHYFLKLKAFIFFLPEYGCWALFIIDKYYQSMNLLICPLLKLSPMIVSAH